MCLFSLILLTCNLWAYGNIQVYQIYSSETTFSPWTSSACHTSNSVIQPHVKASNLPQELLQPSYVDLWKCTLGLFSPSAGWVERTWQLITMTTPEMGSPEVDNVFVCSCSALGWPGDGDTRLYEVFKMYIFFDSPCSVSNGSVPEVRQVHSGWSQLPLPQVSSPASQHFVVVSYPGSLSHMQ